MRSLSNEQNFPKLEQKIQKLWADKGILEHLKKPKPGQKEFAFYDGPPFANGLPHYGHLLATTIKDGVQRYWTMRGYYVDRRFGWDCHGVPVEYEIEKKLGLKGQAGIRDMGVAQFNEACRASVFSYADQWKNTIDRMGRWVDWERQYRTLDPEFMESVWWVFAELFKRGYVYRDFKIVAYSPRITAVLSNFEANQNYQDTQDPSLTVKFKLKGTEGFLLGWTTTPWTLVSNLGLCVGPDIDYVRIKDLETKEIYVLAESRLQAYYPPKKGEKAYEVQDRFKGTELKDLCYEPLFPFFKAQKNAFKVFVDDYVKTTDGTGIVHQAPAYGEDDFRIAKLNQVEWVDPIDAEGAFKEEIAPYAGMYFKEADKAIIQDLKKAGLIYKHETLVHSYPFCERTKTPLMYRAIHTWYVKVEDNRERLCANNQKIRWIPEHLKDGRMGLWLQNASDWAISRNRYWGTPIPIWICDQHDDHRKVLSSKTELEQLTKTEVKDLHKHHIDQLSFPCTQCQGTMKRIEEVFDCWFESGSMPYAQNHYPFEQNERFEQIFPADFIAEGMDQTRGWFYTLSILSTLLFDSPAFKNVVVNGLVLAEDGRKMSKSLKNYTAPDELLEEAGADSVRLYMLNSAILKGENLLFSNRGVKDTTRSLILPLWNALSFLTTYAASDAWIPSKSLAQGQLPPLRQELDRWILSRLQHLTEKVHTNMERYELYKVVPDILGYIDELTNWYIRLNRRRFWGEGAVLSQDTKEAYETLYAVLLGFSKLLAPYAPFISEEIYQILTSDHPNLEGSVHICSIPEVDKRYIDLGLEQGFAICQKVIELGRSLRAKHQIKTRQALRSLQLIARKDEDLSHLRSHEALIKQELNVKEVLYSTQESLFVNLRLKPNLKSLGPRLGADLKRFRTEAEPYFNDALKAHALLEKIESKGHTSFLGVELSESDLLIEREPKDERLIASAHGITVLLDTQLDDALIAEGLARELINRLQKQRKEQGLLVSDRVHLQLCLSTELREAFDAHKAYILGEVLGLSAELVQTPAAGMVQLDFETYSLSLKLTRETQN